MADITIPPSALEAGKDIAFAWLRSHMEDDVRVQNMTDDELGELVEAACLAMLRAWPGMKLNPFWGLRTHKRSVEMILPVSDPPKMDRKAAVAERLFGDD